METNKILQSDYLDLIFDRRNKNYGGYELRKHYNQRAMKALGITFSILLFGIGIPFVMNKLNAKASSVVFADKVPDVIKINEVFIPLPPKPPDAPKPPETEMAAAPPVAKTIQNVTPKILDNNKVKPTMKPPDIKDLEDAVSGPVNNKGEGGNVMAATDIARKGGFGDGLSGKEKKGILLVNDEPVRSPDEMPEFPGGMAALKAFIEKNLRYPAVAREEGIEGRVVITFVVNAQGKIEGATVGRAIGGGCDKEALRVVNAMPNWKPGKQNGHHVKVFYNLPVSFKLQQ